MRGGYSPSKYMKRVDNIYSINKDLLRNMYDTKGIMQEPIYKNNPDSWWTK